MAFVNACCEQSELSGGRVLSRHHIKPVAYNDRGTLKRNVLAYETKGSVDLPLVLDRAPLVAQIGNGGDARFCPVRSDLATYVQFGAPQFKLTDTFQPVSGLSAPSLAKAQSVAWDTADYSMQWLHAGHYASWLMRPRKGWKLPSALLFPMTLSGLTRKGDVFSRAGVPVCHLRSPVARDLANPERVVQLGYDWTGGGVVIDTSKLPQGEWEIDPTLVLQPDAAAGKDTLVYQGVPTNNYGIFPRMATLITTPGLCKFELSAIPSGANCSSVQFTGYQANSGGSAGTWTVTFYSIAVGNANWIQGTRNGAQALAGEPCWAALAANGAGGVTTAWAGTAGLSTAGTDYEIAALGSFSGNRNDVNGTEYSTALTAARVHGWFGVVNTNYGLKLQPSDQVGGIGTSDHATPAYRPMLTVEWMLAHGRAMRGLLNRSML